MSNYRAPVYNPLTNRVEEADHIDNYFGPHAYGIQFAEGPVQRTEDCDPLLAIGRKNIEIGALERGLAKAEQRLARAQSEAELHKAISCMFQKVLARVANNPSTFSHAAAEVALDALNQARDVEKTVGAARRKSSLDTPRIYWSTHGL